jgi:phosphatidate cytidylyltransferase
VREAPIKVQARMPGALRGFGVRALTAVTMGTVLVVADLWGGMLGWAAVVAAVAVPCVIEFYTMMRGERRKPNEVFGIVAVAAMPIATALYATRVISSYGASTSSQLGALGLTSVTAGLIFAALMWLMLASDTATTVFGAIYVGLTLSHLVLLRALDSGAELVVITLASVWAMDTFAYLIGTAIGRHPLAPHISPKKSWEGFAAGTFGTMAAWGIGWWIIRSPLPLWWFLVTGVAVSIAALLGDLAESRLKREVGVKDSGKWFPGHGGFLDRFDSMILVSLVAYYMLVLGGAR